ncbi:hypothetical protein pb186bvf_010134 [Paramecium bursaria]
MHKLSFSGYGLFKKKKQDDQDLAEYRSNPALIEKLLIIKYIMLDEKEREKYIIEAQFVIDIFVKQKIYGMAMKKGISGGVTQELMKKLNIQIILDEYKQMLRKVHVGKELNEDNLIFAKRQKLNFIEFHSTPQDQNQELYKYLKQTLIEDYEFKNIEHFGVGGRQSFVSIVGVFEGSTIILYFNDRPIDFKRLQTK